MRAEDPFPIQDRRETWIDSTTPVTDDPRRVPVVPGPRGPEGFVVLRGGRVIDGTGRAAYPATVVIQRNKIVAVLDEGEEDWPGDARVIDVGGKTVMPGLVDLHVHSTYTTPGLSAALGQSLSDATLRGVERLRYWLESGITSVRDAGSAFEAPFRLKAWVADNRIPGPRVFAAGQLITGTGGHAAERLGPAADMRGTVREAIGPDDWRLAVREQFKRGADIIKVASHFSRDEVAAAVEEAHSLGLKVMCDAETHYIHWAVEAGVDTIEHPLPRTAETIELMSRRGTQAVPTLVPYVVIFDEYGGYFGSTSRRFTFSKEANLELVRQMKQAGIKLGVGTDVIWNGYRSFPTPYITELKQFVAVGFSPLEALVAATRTGAEILDMDDKLGTLKAGKLADVLVVDGSPDVNLDELANVDIVIRDGHMVVDGGCVRIARHVTEPMYYQSTGTKPRKFND